jgi:NAD(P)H dehydrogenase (quinone)
MVKKQCVIVVHSGYGHTLKLAEQVLVGVSGIIGVRGKLVVIDSDGFLSTDAWDDLADADGIIFGCPTYMGGPSWQFKKFADATSKIYAEDGWRDKLGAGFTNSGSISGDKDSTISYIFTLAMQHSMLWVGTGLKPSNTLQAQRNDLNYLGAFSGLVSQSPVDAGPEDAPLQGDLRTGRHFGRRFGNALNLLAVK